MSARLNKSRTFLKMRDQSLTLFELLVAISLISFMVLAFSSIDLFSRHHLLTTDKRAQIQNKVSYVLEHMTKEIIKTIGNRLIAGQDPVDITDIAGDTAIKCYVDLANDGQSSGDGQRNTQGDCWRAYRFTGTTGANKNQIWYYPDYDNPASSREVISQKISAFSRSVTDNFVEISITSIWDPTQTVSIDNPEITMKARIKMPSVSTN